MDCTLRFYVAVHSCKFMCNKMGIVLLELQKQFQALQFTILFVPIVIKFSSNNFIL